MPIVNALGLDPTYRPALFDYADADAKTVTVIGRVVWYCPPLDWNPHQERSLERDGGAGHR